MFGKATSDSTEPPADRPHLGSDDSAALSKVEEAKSE
jgi:hypothetical protein